MRNKKLLWMLVIVILIATVIAGGAEAAFMDSIRGAGGWVRGPGNKYLINTIVIASLLYVGFMLLGKKVETKTGNVMMIIISILLGLIISINIVGNRYVWQTGFLQTIFGVLGSPTRFGIFVGATALFMWFFTFLEVGGEKGFGNKINVVLAVVIGFHLATAETPDVGTVVRAGELIGLLIIYSNVKKTVGEGGKYSQFLAIGLSAVIVFWISAMTFPQYGFFTGEQLAELGKSLGSFGLQVAGIVIVIIATKDKDKKTRFGAIGLVIAAVIGLNFILPEKYGFFSGLKNAGLLALLVGALVLSVAGGKKEGETEGAAKKFLKYAVWNRIVRALKEYVPWLSGFALFKESLRSMGESELQIKLEKDMPMLLNFANRLNAATSHKKRLVEVADEAKKKEAQLDIYHDRGLLWKEIREYEFGEEGDKDKKGYKIIEQEINEKRQQLERERNPVEIERLQRDIDQKEFELIDKIGWKKLQKLTPKYAQRIEEYDRKKEEELAMAEERLKRGENMPDGSKPDASTITEKWQRKITTAREVLARIQALEERKKSHFDTLKGYAKIHKEIEGIKDGLDADDIPRPRYQHPYYLTKRPLPKKGESQSEMEVDENGYVMMDIWEEQDLRFDFRMYHYLKMEIEKLFGRRDYFVKSVWVPNAHAWNKKEGLSGEEVIEEKRVYTRGKINERLPHDLHQVIGVNPADVEKLFNAGNTKIVLSTHPKTEEIANKLKTFRKKLGELLLLVEGSQLYMIELEPKKLFKSSDAGAYNLRQNGNIIQDLIIKNVKKENGKIVGGEIVDKETEGSKTIRYRFWQVKQDLEDVHHKINQQVDVPKGRIEIEEGDKDKMEFCITIIDKFLDKLPFRWVPPIGVEHGNPSAYWFYHLKWSETFQHMKEEYVKWMDSFKDGRYRGASRTFSDYFNVYLKYGMKMFKWKNDWKIAFVTAPSSRLPAFDRRCVPEKMVKGWRFWGRKAWWTQDDGEMGWSTESPDPTTSMRGINQFLVQALERTIEPKEDGWKAARTTLKRIEEAMQKEFSDLKEGEGS